MHEWKFVGVAGENLSRTGLIAACSKCGEVRSLLVIVGGSPDKIDTSGRCPGVPGVDRSVKSY